MDQLKKHLAVVMQYGFWIGAAFVLFGSLAVWYMSTSELSRQSASQMGKIKAEASTVSNLRMEIDSQPNEKSHEKMEEMIAAREKQVLDAWTSIYKDQRGILTWPTDDQIPKEFIEVFRHPKNEETGELDLSREMLPYELYVDYPITETQKVPQRILRTYERYIGKVLPDIAAIAKTKWTADFDSKAGGEGAEFETGFDGMMPFAERSTVNITGQDEGPVVKWSGSSQEEVLADLFPWRGRRPDTLDVYYSQENLWILKQLLEIVAKVNGDANQHFEAKIREIRKLSIGQSVKFGAGTIAQPGIDGGGDMYSDMDEMMSGGEMDSEMSMGGEREAADPGDNRYINMENKPITGSQLRSALKSKSPQDAPLAVAKRVPVMMSLQLDQRFVPLLLAECGSASLMVEVQQVRVLPKSKSSNAESAMDMGDEMDDMSEDVGVGYGTQSNKSQPKEEFPLDVTIEVYGLINIYNPPDRAALGVDQITQDTVIDGAKIGDAKPPTTVESTLPPPTPDAPADPADPAPADPAPADPAPADPAPADPAPADPNATAPNTTTPAPGGPTGPVATTGT